MEHVALEARRIFLDAWLGSHLIIAPASVSPLWPPASLAVLLIWRKMIRPVQIAFRRIDLKYWLDCVNLYLSGHLKNTACRPIMRSSKSLFGHRLKQVRQQNQYNKQCLLKLSRSPGELLQHDTILIRQFWAGEFDAAQPGFIELNAIYKNLDDCLAKYA